jgi:hypothetical protein
VPTVNYGKRENLAFFNLIIAQENAGVLNRLKQD